GQGPCLQPCHPAPSASIRQPEDYVDGHLDNLIARTCQAEDHVGYSGRCTRDCGLTDRDPGNRRKHHPAHDRTYGSVEGTIPITNFGTTSLYSIGINTHTIAIRDVFFLTLNLFS
ncbi:hypothetical protein GW17_00059873, partial [Ensete ventricosum]